MNFSLNEDIKLIPRWSVVLAVAGFVGMQYINWVVLPARRHHPGPPIGLSIYFSLSWSALTAAYFLMLGYVSRDSPRRAMSTRFWMMICLLMPGGPGAVMYFLMRQPIISRCPECASTVESTYHFCPQCSYHLISSCGNCHDSVRPVDLYCARCGHDLAKDTTPARLHVMQR